MKCSLCVGCHIGHDPHRLLSSFYKSGSPGKQSHWVSHGRGASLGFPWGRLVLAPGSTVGSLPNSSDLMSITWKVGVFIPQKLAMSTVGSSRCITQLWKKLGKWRSGIRRWRMRCHLLEALVDKTGLVEESRSQVCAVVEGKRGSSPWGPWKILRPCNSCCYGFAAEV